MQISLTPKEIFVCHKVWDDIKGFSGLNSKICRPVEESDNGTSDLQKLKAIPLTNAILNVLINPENDHGSLCGHQPFLEKGWKIYKLRYRIGNRGDADSLRVIYAMNGSILILAHIYPKKPTKRDRDIIAEYCFRLKAFAG